MGPSRPGAKERWHIPPICCCYHQTNKHRLIDERVLRSLEGSMSEACSCGEQRVLFGAESTRAIDDDVVSRSQRCFDDEWRDVSILCAWSKESGQEMDAHGTCRYHRPASLKASEDGGWQTSPACRQRLAGAGLDSAAVARCREKGGHGGRPWQDWQTRRLRRSRVRGCYAWVSSKTEVVEWLAEDEETYGSVSNLSQRQWGRLRFFWQLPRSAHQ